MIVKTFDPEHFSSLNLQSAQNAFNPFLMDKGYIDYIMMGDCYSLFDDERLVCCAGIFPMWAGRAYGWAFIAESVSGPELLKITRVVRRYFAVSEYTRIETNVDAGFEQGHRWARLLGMQQEGLMRKFSPDGEDMYLYARIK